MGSLRNRVARSAGALCLLAFGAQALAQSPACQVTYTKSWEGGNGYGANLEIRNTGAAINGWSLVFSFANGERIQNGWPVTFSQSVATTSIGSACTLSVPKPQVTLSASPSRASIVSLPAGSLHQ